MAKLVQPVIGSELLDTAIRILLGFFPTCPVVLSIAVANPAFIP